MVREGADKLQPLIEAAAAAMDGEDRMAVAKGGILYGSEGRFDQLASPQQASLELPHVAVEQEPDRRRRRDQHDQEGQEQAAHSM
ncbi:MAG: hypothetical protein E5W09_21500 [Mesorhizobium sp.]|nr:MAG: hypothetical protein E5W09_21500 [Mesorhizobium sp.]